MSAPSLAIIVTYVGEYPHLHYTLQSLYMELRDAPFTWEIIVVDNYCAEARERGVQVGGAHPDNWTALDAFTRKEPALWLKRLEYREKMSHWSCKNHAIKNTGAEFLFFLDAHAMVSAGSLREAFSYYRERSLVLNGSLHLPISDFFRTEAKQYRLLLDPEIGLLHYENEPYDRPHYNGRFTLRPCNSTCGMLIRRDWLVNDLGLWPEELGPYGGGENFLNFGIAKLGMKSYIFDAQPIYHWHIPGEWSRDYRISYYDWARNIMIATFVVCGPDWLSRLTRNKAKLPEWHPVKKLDDGGLRTIYEEILTSQDLINRYERLQAKAVTTIEEWGKRWTTERTEDARGDDTRNDECDEERSGS